MTVPTDQDPRPAPDLDPLQPMIDLPRAGLPGWALAAIAGVLALALFTLLDSRRLARDGATSRQASQINLGEPAPLLAIPQPAPEVGVTPTPTHSPSVAAIMPMQPTYQPSMALTPPVFRPVMRPPADDVYAPPRYHTDTPASSIGSAGSTAMVVDMTTGKGAAVNGSDAAGDSSDDAVRATVIRNRAAVVQQGVIIAAVLETPLNSDRPGMARAIVSSDVRSFDGSRVLIPRGSRLIGDFKADNNPGMRRILVTWNRLIRPDGVAIRIGSPASDPLGGAGVPGSVNTHFLERFAGAVLQSALTIGVNVASQIPNNGSNIYVGLPSQATQLGQDLVPDTKRAPTVKVKAGAQIAIFVAHDLDFGGTPAVR